MTLPTPDLLLHEGRWLSLASDPLGSWLDRRHNRHLRFRRTAPHGLRGYRTQWEIHRGRLFLTGFRARLANGRFAGMGTIFDAYSSQFYDEAGANDAANQGPGRFAFWCSGPLVCPLGARLEYGREGPAQLHQGTLLLDFQRGRLVGQRVEQISSALAAA